jgi:hypothetical protein
VVHVFRQEGKDEGAVELVETADHFDAVLITGCVIGGEPTYSKRRVRVRGEPQVLEYRFQPASWRRGSDFLFLSSERPMLSPKLKVVHDRTGKTLAHIRPQRVGPVEIRIDLSPSIVGRRGLKRSAYRRLLGSSSFTYRVELANQADNLSVHLAHPQSPQDQRLSVAWF